MNENNTKIHCFVAGKSGGHILPALTMAQAVLDDDPSCSVLFFCTTAPLDKKLIKPQQRLRIVFLPLTGMYRNKLLFPLVVARAVFSCIYAFFILVRLKPHAILSTGGLIGIPVGLAAFLLRIPFDLFELNVIPGRAITWLAPLARTIFICFEKSKSLLPAYKCVVHPYPLRKPLLKHFNDCHSKTKKVLFILGGSQGSVFLNILVSQWLATVADTMKKELVVIHQTGDAEVMQWHHFYQQQGLQAQVFSFNHDIGTFYQQADLIVCRSGAGTLFEVCHFKKACITIPVKTATTDHQLYNAQEMARTYSFIHCLKQEDVEGNKKMFFDLVNECLSIAA